MLVCVHPQLLSLLPPCLYTDLLPQAAAEFVGMTLSELKAEPERLSNTRKALNEKIQVLSMENYRVHIDNHNCGKIVRTEVCSSA